MPKTTIATANGPLECEAVTLRGTNKTLCLTRFEYETDKFSWTITHKPTGYAFRGGLTKEQASLWAKEFWSALNDEQKKAMESTDPKDVTAALKYTRVLYQLLNRGT